MLARLANAKARLRAARTLSGLPPGPTSRPRPCASVNRLVAEVALVRERRSRLERRRASSVTPKP